MVKWIKIEVDPKLEQKLEKIKKKIGVKKYAEVIRFLINNFDLR